MTDKRQTLADFPRRGGTAAAASPQGDAASQVSPEQEAEAAAGSGKLRRLKWIVAGAGLVVMLAAGGAFYFQSMDADSTPVEDVKGPLPPDVQAMVDAGNYGEALDKIGPMVGAHPEDVDLVTEAARLNFLAKRYKPAREMAQQALDLDPGRAINHAIIGATDFQRSQFEAALNASVKAIQLNPRLSLPYLTLGEIQLRRGKKQEALTALKEAARFGPENARTWSILSAAYIKLKDFDRALVAAKAAVEVDPDYPGAHFNLAQIYFRFKDPTQALDHIQKAEILYRAEDNTRWVSRSRQHRDLILKHFKMRPQDVTG
ncbi:MAG: tetratricopeptide repeat protein [Nitrospinaceae bacterium]